MSIITVTVAAELKEFDGQSTLADVWDFVSKAMENHHDNEVGVVFRDDGGDTLGDIWDQSMFEALCESPDTMRGYFNLVGFDPAGDNN